MHTALMLIYHQKKNLTGPNSRILFFLMNLGMRYTNFLFITSYQCCIISSFFIFYIRRNRLRGIDMAKKNKIEFNAPLPPPLPSAQLITSPNKKTHQRSQSDATGLFQSLRRPNSGK